MKWFVGVDGGGTKTDFAVSTGDSVPTATRQLAGCSYQALGVGEAVTLIVTGVSECLAAVGATLADCAGCCIGMPCYGENAKKDKAAFAALQAALAPAPITVVNDVEVGLAGSLACQEGIHIVAGTGSIAIGRGADKKTQRCGGWNEFFGDEGSCYWVGRETMRLFSKEADGRAPRGALYTLVHKEFTFAQDCDFFDIVMQELAPQRERVAWFQKLAQQAADAGDAAAVALYVEAANELSLMVAALKEKLVLSPGKVKVSYSGGLFKAGELVLQPLREKVAALGCTLQAPMHSAIEGALILAIEHFK